MKQALKGIGVVVIAGVITYWLTDGFEKWGWPSGSERIEKTYTFSMVGLDQLAGRDCEMDTDPNDVVTVNFDSELSHSASEVFLDVSYDATEYKGNGTKIGKRTRVAIYKARSGKKIERLEHRGPSIVKVADFGAGGRNWDFRPFDNLTASSYWDTLRFKVDDDGPNDCASAGVEGTISYAVILASSPQ